MYDFNIIQRKMGIIIDIIILSIILLSTYLGYRKGLIGVAFKILSFIIAILITVILFKPVTLYVINTTTIDENIENAIIEKFGSANITEQGVIDKKDLDAPEVLINYVNESIKNTVEQSKDAIIKSVARDLSINIINVIVMIGLFIITRVLLIFAKVLFEAVSELPVVKQFNEIGGIIYGILRGLLIILIILAIISLILPMIDKTGILEIINTSFIGKLLYNNNLILMILF